MLASLFEVRWDSPGDHFGVFIRPRKRYLCNSDFLRMSVASFWHPRGYLERAKMKSTCLLLSCWQAFAHLERYVEAK